MGRRQGQKLDLRSGVSDISTMQTICLFQKAHQRIDHPAATQPAEPGAAGEEGSHRPPHGDLRAARGAPQRQPEPLVRLPQPPPEPHQDLTYPTNPSHPSFPLPAPWGPRSGASGWVRTSQRPLSLQPGGTVFPRPLLLDDSRSHPWDREAKRAVKE